MNEEQLIRWARSAPEDEVKRVVLRLQMQLMDRVDPPWPDVPGEPKFVATTERGKSYHLARVRVTGAIPRCGFLVQCQGQRANGIATQSNARLRGLTPCKICRRARMHQIRGTWAAA